MPKPTPVFQDIKAQLIEANEQRTVTNEQVMELNQTFKDMYAMEQQSKLDALEASREASNAIGSQQAGLQAAAQGLASDTEKKSGGFLSKLLGGGMMVAAAAALGAVVAGILAFMKLDVDNIINNVKKLFSINDMVDGIGGALMEGGTFFLIMSGLGAGLAIFGAGSAIAGMSDALLNFTNPNWVQSIIDNVAKLLTINDLVGGNILKALGEGGIFLSIMTGLGLGLAIFGVGSAVAGMSDALTNFANPNWAQSIYDNVKILLDISTISGGSVLETLGKTGTFVGIMMGLAAGLVAFGYGSAIAGLSDALTNFVNPNWAQSIVDNVGILLTISNHPLQDTAAFVTTMAGLAAGLIAFAGGQAISAVLSFFVDDKQAENVAKNVSTLIGIVNDPQMGDDPVYKATQFKSALTVIGEGLANFSKGSFIGALAGAGESILGFFGLGRESPFEAILGVAQNADGLDKGADAVERLGFSLEKISKLKFEGGGMGLQELAEDMLQAIPAIETAVNGGTVGEGWISSGTQIKGLASPDIKFDEAVENIKKIRVLIGADLASAQAEAAQGRQAAAGGGTVVNNTTNNSGGGSMMIAPQASVYPNSNAADFFR